jgi:hypothetical protein
MTPAQQQSDCPLHTVSISEIVCTHPRDGVATSPPATCTNWSGERFLIDSRARASLRAFLVDPLEREVFFNIDYPICQVVYGVQTSSDF